MTTVMDKTKLLEALEKVDLEQKEKHLDQLRNLSLGTSLLHLAGLDHEREYQTCAAVARHLLDRLPEPESVDFED